MPFPVLWPAGGWLAVHVDLVAVVLVVACPVPHVRHADLMTWLAVSWWLTTG